MSITSSNLPSKAEVESFARGFSCHLGKPLGKGSFGKVYQIHPRIQGPSGSFALKVGDIDSLTIERDIFRHIQQNGNYCKYLVQGLGYLETPSFGALKLSTLSNAQNLERYYLASNRTITVSDYKRISKAALKALQYLHRRGIAHKDLKPNNIIVSPGRSGVRKALLIDLGHAQNQFAHESRPNPSNPLYSSPQAIVDLAQSDPFKADIYALGAVLWEIIAKEPLFVFPEEESCPQNPSEDYLLSNEGKELALSCLGGRRSLKSQEQLDMLGKNYGLDDLVFEEAESWDQHPYYKEFAIETKDAVTPFLQRLIAIEEKERQSAAEALEIFPALEKTTDRLERTKRQVFTQLQVQETARGGFLSQILPSCELKDIVFAAVCCLLLSLCTQALQEA